MLLSARRVAAGRAAGRLLAVAALGAAACGGGRDATPRDASADAAGPDPSTCHFGDPARPLEVAIVVRPGDAATEAVDLAAGGPLALIRPPQFGRVVLVGVRATNFDGCLATLNAAVRDPCTGRVLGLEERPVTLAPRGDGWAVPFEPSFLNNYANVALCPVALPVDVLDRPATVEVRLTDGAGRVATATATATPTCAGQEPDCAMECAPPGPAPDAGCAPVDAPVDAGAARDPAPAGAAAEHGG